jgi:catalase
MHNNQRDGFMRQEINVGRVSYHPNSLGGGCPYQAKIAEGGFASFNERVEAHKVRGRSESFSDHFSQARLFYNSQTDVEKSHMVRALRFELGKVDTTAIRVRMLGLLSQVDMDLATKVAEGLRLTIPTNPETPMNHGVSPDADPNKHEPKEVTQKIKNSLPLSMINNPTNSPTIESRKVAIICADGVSDASVLNMKSALLKESAKGFIVAPYLGFVSTDEGGQIPVDYSLLTASSVLFDAIYVAGGSGLTTGDGDVMDWINDTYKHCKVIGAEAEGIDLLAKSAFADKISNKQDEGVIMAEDSAGELFAQSFIKAMSRHRIWEREAQL